jgi:exonuclease-1
VAAVVTEDSDLIVYGCRLLVFKMDSQGHGDGFELESLLGAEPPAWVLCADTGRLLPGVLSFRSFNMEMLRALGVLAGCDFLPSLKGMGFKKAHCLVSKYKKDFKLDRVSCQEP